VDPKKPKPVTAAELTAQLEADPEWVRKRRERARVHGERLEQNRRDSKPLREELAAAGFEVSSVAELYNSQMNYEKAIPLLLRWLPKIENPDIKESVVRALTVDWARPQAAPILIEEFRRVTDPSGTGLRWAIGNALATVADDSVFGEVAELAEDRRWGKAREMVTVALGNMRDPRAVPVLQRLLADEEVAGHALIALGNLRAKEAQADIEPFLDHPTPWVRSEAQKALAKLGD
jgi:HEAT repeat protein